jgi:hypothetical protein
MNTVINGFSFTRILQALYYIQSKAPSSNPDRFDILYLLKMIFFSDRYHLRNYGITATGDNYYAMKRGPVASATFDLLKGRYEKHSSAIQGIDEYNVRIKPQEKDELSKSFKEAIDFALKEFGDFDKEKLSNISHCYPEWKKHEKKLLRIAKSVQMNEMDFFENPNDSYFKEFGKKCDPFKEEDEEFLALRKEHYHAYHASR